jgi:hypothetical protein
MLIEYGFIVEDEYVWHFPKQVINVYSVVNQTFTYIIKMYCCLNPVAGNISMMSVTVRQVCTCLTKSLLEHTFWSINNMCLFASVLFIEQMNTWACILICGTELYTVNEMQQKLCGRDRIAWKKILSHFFHFGILNQML